MYIGQFLSLIHIYLREKGKMREIERIINKKFIMGEMPSGKQICEQQLIKLIDNIEKVKVNDEEIESFLPGIYRKLEWLSLIHIFRISHDMALGTFPLCQVQ